MDTQWTEYQKGSLGRPTTDIRARRSQQQLAPEAQIQYIHSVAVLQAAGQPSLLAATVLENNDHIGDNFGSKHAAL
eukprot:scaffold2514_cov226-Alexandrium_tamarense.AAC.9